MGRNIRWQAILALMGALLLIAYLRSIVVTRVTRVVPTREGILQEGYVGHVQFLNPLLAAYNPVDRDIAALIFEGLLKDDGRGNLQPVLAQAVTTAPDGLSYTYTLRSDVKWSDGQPFTSDDVDFTAQVIQTDQFPGNPILQQVWQNVSVIPQDAHTVVFTLTNPLPSFPYYTTIGLLPAHQFGNQVPDDLLTHPFNLNPVGTGPYKLNAASQSRVTLIRNPFYHVAGKITQIDFVPFQNQRQLSYAFSHDQIDAVSAPGAETLRQMESLTDTQFFSSPLPRLDTVFLNLQRPEALPFFQDAKLRSALLMAIDRQAIIDQILPRQAVKANGPFLPWRWAQNPNQVFPDYNPSEATRLLDEAGWLDSDGDGIRDRDGLPFTFSLKVSNNPIYEAVGQVLVEQWRKIGVAVQLELVDNLALSQDLNARNFEAILVEMNIFGDPDPYRFWHQSQIESGQNFAGWVNPLASQMLAQGRNAQTRQERLQYYYTFQEIFAKETPSLILHYPVYTYGTHERIKDIQMSQVVSPADRFDTVQQWYLITQRVLETTQSENFFE